MRFSMFSPLKKADKEFLLELGEMVELLLRLGAKNNNTDALDLAEKYGEWYVELEQKIKLHDYSPDDARYEFVTGA